MGTNGADATMSKTTNAQFGGNQMKLQFGFVLLMAFLAAGAVACTRDQTGGGNLEVAGPALVMFQFFSRPACWLTRWQTQCLPSTSSVGKVWPSRCNWRSSFSSRSSSTMRQRTSSALWTSKSNTTRQGASPRSRRARISPMSSGEKLSCRFVLQKINNGLMTVLPGIVHSDLAIITGKGTVGPFV